MTNKELYYIHASELLRHIQAEKERLIKDKVIKKSKPLPTITDEEKPYELPVGWEWVRLGEVVQFNPRNKCDDDLDAGFIPMTLIEDGFSNKHRFEVKKWKDIKSGYTHFANGDVIFAKITPCFENRKSAIVRNLPNQIGAGTTEVITLRSYGNTILPELLFSIVTSPEFINGGKNTYQGTAGQQRVNIDYLKNYIIPLPPLYIQDQIVQKLEQLSTTKDSLLSHAESQLNYTKKMRETLLQEAIRGELVPQDEDDEPAFVLLEKIKTERERLIQEKIIKKSKPLPPITEDEKPYELPTNWEWVRLGDLVSKVGSGSTPKGGSKVYQEDGIKFIRSQNVYNDTLKLDDIVFISEEIHEKMKGTQVLPNDLLLNITGGSIGRCSLVPQNFDTGNVNQHVSIIRLIKGLNIRYFHKVIISRYIQNLIMDVQVGMSREGLSKEKIELFPIPLPPLADQERIVAKLDELMEYCDQLELTAEEMQQSAIKLFEVSLKEAFVPE